MSTPDANVSGAATAGTAAGAGTQLTTLQIMSVLIRRELWEHRALWMAPLVIAALLVICAFPITIGSMHVGSDPAFWSNPGNRLGMFTLLQWGLTAPQYLVMAIVLNFYLLDCLYMERKDRSILFWKSMPVSDGATVVSKLLTALVVAPLGVYVLSLVTNLLFSGILLTRLSIYHVPGAEGLWDTVVWLKVEALLLYAVVVAIIWSAPLAAYLLLVSAWARRSVFLWAALPPVFAVVVERIAFGTHYVSNLIAYRTWGIWNTLQLDKAMKHTADSHDDLASLPGMFDSLNLSQTFLNIDLWLGVAVAAGLVYAATRVRRYRDDT